MGQKKLAKEYKKNYGVYLSIELMEKFRVISEKTGIPLSRLVEDAMKEALLKY